MARQAWRGSGGKALLFTILTGARTGETIGATWDEIGLAQKLWVIPAERMKAAKEHRVPLNKPVLSLLQEMTRESRYVFPGSRRSKPLGNMSMLKCLRTIRSETDETVHGFRSSFRDWAAAQTD